MRELPRPLVALLDDGRMQCDLCPRDCRLHEGQRGACFVRKRERRRAWCSRPTAAPPASASIRWRRSRSTSSIPARASCPSAPRAATSRASSARTGTSPSRATWTAWRTRPRPRRSRRRRAASGCRSVAFTYNDPVIFAEYAMDIADACHARGIKTVAVTAGYMHEAPRREFYAKMDAANVDLKAFTDEFYFKQCGARLAAGARHARVPQARDRRLVRDHDAAHPRQERLQRGDRGRVPLDHEGARARRAAPLHRVSSRLQDDRHAPHAGDDAAPRARASRSPRDCATSTPATSTTPRAARPTARAAGRRSSCATGTRSRQHRVTPDGSCPDCGAAIAGRYEKFGRAFGPRRIPVAIHRPA